MKNSTILSGLLAIATAVSSFASPGYPPESQVIRDATIGTVLGAGAGAVIGNQSGSRDKGAAIGAVAGGLFGTIIGRNRDAAKREEWRRAEAARMERERLESEYRAEAVRVHQERSQKDALTRGMILTDADVNAARERAMEAQRNLARLRAERAAALARAQAVDAAEAAEREANAELLGLNR